MYHEPSFLLPCQQSLQEMRMPGTQLYFPPGQPKPLSLVLGTVAAKTLCGTLSDALKATLVSSPYTKMPLSLTSWKLLTHTARLQANYL